jgi:hypothetical protein
MKSLKKIILILMVLFINIKHISNQGGDLSQTVDEAPLELSNEGAELENEALATGMDDPDGIANLEGNPEGEEEMSNQLL